MNKLNSNYNGSTCRFNIDSLLNHVVILFGAVLLLSIVGCTSQSASNTNSQDQSSQRPESELKPSTTSNSSIPNEREFEQQKGESNELIKESERLEKEADDLIGDQVPKGEQVYKNLSKGKCDWLKQRADFYERFADSLSNQASRMTPGSSPQIATAQQADVARKRATSFDNEVKRRCLGEQ